MKFRFFLSIVYVLLSLSCSDKNNHFSNFKDIKSLEYNRSSNIHLWQAIYKDAEKKIKQQILVSAAKTKNDSLAPFLNTILDSEQDEDILASCIFALGQLSENKGELSLVRFFNHTKKLTLKKSLLAAFEQCGTASCLPLIKESLSNDSLRAQALQTAAILARKKVATPMIKQMINDSLWAYSGLKENAYYTYNAVQPEDIAFLAQKISATKDRTQKYYLKALSKLTRQNILPPDSLMQEEYKVSLRNILEGKTLWQNQIYALQSFAFFADSTDETLIKKLCANPNVHVQMEAVRTFGKVYKEDGISFLLNTLQNEDNYGVKGCIIYTLTEINPQSAYRLIMQNMDKGTTSFKQDLLRALALYKDPLALNALRNFLSVSDQRLSAMAFDLLNDKKLIHFSDIENIMQSNNFIMLYKALDWQKTHNRFVDNDALLNVFGLFNAPEQNDIQKLVIEIFSQRRNKPDITGINDIIPHIDDKQIFEKLVQVFPEIEYKKDFTNETLPGFLSVDSLMTLPNQNIKVEISTNKGEIELELFVKDAPLTVKNFIVLAEDGFYNNLIFHRVIADFVIQGGDPQGTGWGGNSYTIPSEDYLPFERGTIGIATSGFDTGSCQFFICQSEQPHLRGDYTAFGKVTDGFEVVDNIQIDDRIISIKLLDQH